MVGRLETTSKHNFGKCVSGFSRTRLSKISPTHSRSSLAGFVLLALSAAFPLLAQTRPPVLTTVPTRDQKVVRRWSLAGDPHGIALGKDGIAYIGLAQTQEVIGVDTKNGDVVKRIVLDSAEIASTKELVTMRTNRDRTRLYIANGSDESASILSLPNLGVVREITMEGEAIRDVLPDPAGRYLYLLGRHVHIFDANGEHEIRTINVEDPTAIAASSNGNMLAVIGSQMFGRNKATVVALYDAKTFAEIARDPLQTTDSIETALFADGDRALIAASRQHLFEKHLNTRSKPMTTGANGQMRMSIDFGDLVSSDQICLPEKSGPQIVVRGAGDLVLFAERRCNSSGAFTGAERRITPASLYGVDAYALAFEPSTSELLATDRAGYLTIYRVPRVAATK
jgi:hypothetical protein